MQQSEPSWSPGILLVGHGTRDLEGQAGFLATADELARRWSDRKVAACFLELAEPTIPEAIGELARQGVRQLIVVPVLLFAAGHAKEDIPEAVAEACTPLGLVVIGQTRPLEWHPRLVELVATRFRETLADRSPVPLDETLVILVGRGSGDPEAGRNLHTLGSAVAQALGVPRLECCFYAMAQPRLPETLASAAQGPFRRVVVLSHFLFAGQLPARVREMAFEAGQGGSEQEWLVAPVLGPHPLLVDALVARCEEVLES
jgi:sirohydrochlorin cobaltochelatase